MICAILLTVALHGFPASAEATVTEALHQVGSVTGNTFVIDNSSAHPDLDVWLTPGTWRSEGAQALAVSYDTTVQVFAPHVQKSGWGWERGDSLGPVLLHEFGHVYGMDHSWAEASVMYPAVDRFSPTRYSSADRRNLRATCHQA